MSKKDKPKKSAYIKNFMWKLIDLFRIIGMVAVVFLIIFTLINYGKLSAVTGQIGFLIIIALEILLEVVLHKLSDVTSDKEAEARNDIEFDENGLYRKKNNIQKLSKAEREELGKQRLAEVERLLGTGTLRKITKDGSDCPMADLKAMTGLIPVKKKVKEIAARTEFDRKEKLGGSDSGYHMCLYGNPGTGKTTIVKIITGILYKEKIISKNQFLEIDGNSLRGDTARETAEKISLLVRFSKGKVLFIDEAYAMLDASDSQDVIATLIKAMEDHRKDFVLIVAGYEQEMKQMIEANPGFKSRISTYLHFPDYDGEQMCEIFNS
ncbi:MAG: AAA family ATPase, partial [Candidatus Weimeria sp.]